MPAQGTDRHPTHSEHARLLQVPDQAPLDYPGYAKPRDISSATEIIVHTLEAPPSHAG